ncbi:MAG: hypothetical protein UU29_C0009G0062 [Candidatus Daviesbacteria bacterium GW2011_GWA2_40_9]|uniref:Uncharacterized protein n=1 Tax=Candidatus Daviesbacteria bacterium GW2011_GWA2_40_9 TaxID=1618424 RepID=A0A0G0U6G6_9BACT|nr:MAG: hypothetical protein UU26_C0010G0005 [Candidatus Daviesbacteria bacterium GW2011_GWC1_40_9]KKR82791.1 MAG: hypothetical protein UU29_C0009G0062 [Candidatus Daviesbacteria bacterium GW2011_GWA2_40_9]
MQSPTLIHPVGFADCPLLEKLITSLIANLLIYLPAILAILVAFWLIKKNHIRKRKIYYFLAGLLLLSAIAYRLWLNTEGAPLVYLTACI